VIKNEEFARKFDLKKLIYVLKRKERKKSETKIVEALMSRKGAKLVTIGKVILKVL